ncbi:hypothetical protein [Rhizobium sp. FKL33]|uniref:hypothetical protein n=1 Tax=Rhizobium sp. FKL33 TaxID=2562307 RepID=UPI0010C05492|nr:hypothetical protein [Rhizobium sp. FKL33]
MRGAADVSAPDASVITGAIGGLLRPATTGLRVQAQSVALAELCRADLRAEACRQQDAGRHRAQARLRAALKRDQALTAATKSEDIGEPGPAGQDGDCVEDEPCPLPVARRGATVVTVVYRQEESVPTDLLVSPKPVRMVGGLIVKTYR